MPTIIVLVVAVVLSAICFTNKNDCISPTQEKCVLELESLFCEQENSYDFDLNFK